MFEKTLTDIVKGIRASKRDTALYISQCINEIKNDEITSSDIYVKVNAIQKLTFLQMMGYSSNPWSSFTIIEVMSSQRFAYKRVGYLGACQTFTQDTEVILLTTNLLQKELRSSSTLASSSSSSSGVGSSSSSLGGFGGTVYDVGLAINCLSNIVTKDLACDLLSDVTNLTSHPSPYIRKKAILCLYKLFIKYPYGLRLSFHKIQQCLQNDNHPSVISCAVNVITELSDKNPNNYLHLAPTFFNLLTNSSNNWMLIKVVKLLGSLVIVESRLARKLLEPLCNIVRNTQAKSLLYEAVYTITLCLPHCHKNDGTIPTIVPDVVALCAHTLKNFVEQTDQNLKYLGLVGYSSLMKYEPRILSNAIYKPLILSCLSDHDTTIRLRALDLLHGIITRKNLQELIKQLMKHVQLSTGTYYKNELIYKIIELCSLDKYAYITDFQWYFYDVLIQLGYYTYNNNYHNSTGGGAASSFSSTVVGVLLHNQIIDVALRVLPVRTYAVRRSIEILLLTQQQQQQQHQQQMHRQTASNVTTMMKNKNHKLHKQRMITPEILPALAWILGEYSNLIPDAISLSSSSMNNNNHNKYQDLSWFADNEKGGGGGIYYSIIRQLTEPSNNETLSTTTQKMYIQASMKVLAAAAAAANATATTATTSLLSCNDDEIEDCVLTIHEHLPIYMQSIDVEVVERAFAAVELLNSLQLTTTVYDNDQQPGLLSLATSGDDDDDDDDEDDDGDLLRMGKSNARSRNQKVAAAHKTELNNSLANRVKDAASLLSYLYKPSPMKPVGAKAQRKKRQQEVGRNIDLDAPVDLTAFQDIINEEEAYRASTKLTMASVSFTQQRPLKMVDSSCTTTSLVQQQPFDSHHRQSTAAGAAASTSFHGGQQARQSDPFYLSSSGDKGNKDKDKDNGGGNRFGTIQLVDDDDDEEVDQEKKKSKKKQKKANKKASSSSTSKFRQSSSDGGGVILLESDDDDDDDDVAMDPKGKSRKAQQKQQQQQRPLTAGREFAGLARVDLTTPLREDEVMPQRTHRVVPDRPPPQKVQQQQQEVRRQEEQKQQQESGKKKAKDKKAKKSKKKTAETSSSVGDLLDLGGFMDVTTTTTTNLGVAAAATGTSPREEVFAVAATGENVTSPPTPPPEVVPTMPTSTNPINSAFDDLLGLSAPIPAPQLPPGGVGIGLMSGGLDPSSATLITATTDATSVHADSAVNKKKKKSSTKTGKRPWMKASIKSGTGNVDWSMVSCLYRVYRSNNHEGGGGGGVTASVMVMIKIINGTSKPMNGVYVDVPGQGRVDLEMIGPGSSVETEKVGPLPYLSADDSTDCKFSIKSSDDGSKATLKLTLPATIHLSPVEDLAFEQVVAELGQSGWSSHTAKVDLSTGCTVDDAKYGLSNFLRAAEVNDSPGAPSSACCFASSSSATGAKVRILMKFKGSSIKVDVKSTNAQLGKALSSDLKRLQL